MAGRALGLDLGSKRIGVAVSDAARTLAGPLTTLARSGSRTADHRRIAELVRDEEATIVVVGLPVNMDGTLGAAARAATTEAEALASVVGVPVITVDERRSTVTAQRMLIDGGRGARARRARIDEVAATVILQHWLDGGAGR